MFRDELQFFSMKCIHGICCFNRQTNYQQYWSSHQSSMAFDDRCI